VGEILPSIIFPGDVKALQLRLQAATLATDAGVQQCAALDDSTRQGWGSFYVAAMSYVALVPVYALPIGKNETATTGTLYDRGLSLEQELFAWQKKLQGIKCALNVPLYDPTPPKSVLPNIIEWASVAVGAVAIAYVVDKGVGLVERVLPSKKQ